MITVAFLQNQWFKDPASVRQVFDRHPDKRQELIARFLFGSRCLTGRRLKAAFGGATDSIIWEQSSPEIGWHSGSTFKADQQHIVSVIEQFRPDIVLTFGTIAKKAVFECCSPLDFRWWAGPHPAARQRDVMYELKRMAKWLLLAEIGRIEIACVELMIENEFGNLGKAG